MCQRKLCGSAAAVLLLVLSSGTVRAEDPPTVPSRVLIGPLVAAGVPLDDVSQLVQLLSTNDRGLAVNAAYALGLLPPSGEAVRGLRKVLKSDDEVLVEYTVGALLNQGDKSWVPLIGERLPLLRSLGVRLQVAATLARAGSYVGWPLVKNEIVDPDTGRFLIVSLMNIVPAFVGMKDEAGHEVDLVEELREMLPKAAPANRESVAQAMRALAAERARRSKPD
jgi:hypothetical protein